MARRSEVVGRSTARSACATAAAPSPAAIANSADTHASRTASRGGPFVEQTPCPRQRRADAANRPTPSASAARPISASAPASTSPPGGRQCPAVPAARLVVPAELTQERRLRAVRPARPAGRRGASAGQLRDRRRRSRSGPARRRRPRAATTPRRCSRPRSAASARVVPNAASARRAAVGDHQPPTLSMRRLPVNEFTMRHVLTVVHVTTLTPVTGRWTTIAATTFGANCGKRESSWITGPLAITFTDARGSNR